MAHLLYCKVYDKPGLTTQGCKEEAALMFLKELPRGYVKIRYLGDKAGQPDEVKPIDDLPRHWQEQLRQYSNFGKGV